MGSFKHMKLKKEITKCPNALLYDLKIHLNAIVNQMLFERLISLSRRDSAAQCPTLSRKKYTNYSRQSPAAPRGPRKLGPPPAKKKKGKKTAEQRGLATAPFTRSVGGGGTRRRANPSFASKRVIDQSL